uniref:hypothetical protein n=1 Tax=uncultured Draconibacterium sp. TaxID=1573823 RepID=UPI003217A31D
MKGADLSSMSIYPDDAFSCPENNVWPAFERLECQIQEDVITRAALFLENEIKLVKKDDHDITQWRFRSKKTDTTGLLIFGAIRRNPESITFSVGNHSSNSLTIKIICYEVHWQIEKGMKRLPWMIGQKQILKPGEERELTFSFSNILCLDKENVKDITYPISVSMVVEGLKPEIDYQLDLSQFTVHYPSDLELELKRLDVPAVLSASNEVNITLDVVGNIKGKQLDLELRNDKWILWRIRQNNDETSICRIVPWWIASGNYNIGLVVDGYRVEGSEKQVWLINNFNSSLAKAERRKCNGRPTLFVDGEPFAWQGYSFYDYQPGSVMEFGEHGSNLFLIPTCAGSHLHHCAATTWIAPGEFDFGEITERVSFSLQGNPDGKICLRVSLTMPPFSTQKHTDELAQIRTDKGDLVWEETSTRSVSLASEAWRRDQEMALRKLIEFCKSQPWANRLIGILISAEVTEEWFAWGCNNDVYADYGKRTQQEFKKWLNAHHMKGEIPSPTIRKSKGNEIYPNTAEGQLAAAYNQFYSDLTAETIGYFSKIIKDETEGRLITGSFYGYVIQLSGESRQSLAGHFSLRKLIDNPNVDFIAGIPVLDDYRQLERGYGAFTTTVSSLQAVGKLFFIENDLFFWLHHGIWHTLGTYDPNNPREAAYSMHRRVTALSAVYGVMEGKFSLRTSWHHDDGLQNEFRKLIEVYTKSLEPDRSPVEEIAFIVDDNSFAHTPPDSKMLNVNKQLLLNLGLTGAPVGVWLKSDLDKLPNRIKLVVIGGCHSPLSEDAIKLDKLIEMPDKMVMISEKDKIEKPNMLRELVEKAGVHCYAPVGCSVHASMELVSITGKKGEITLEWPRNVNVEDMFDGWTANGKIFLCPFATGQARLFKLT